MPVVGQTIRITANNMKDSGGTALVSPTVAITITDSSGNVIDGSVQQVNGSYYAKFTPTNAGTYIAKVTATAGGETCKARETVKVDAG